MGCFAQIREEGTPFKYKREVQKYFIEFILTYGDYDLKSLAVLLEVSAPLLSQVVRGSAYLEEEVANKLLDWVFILIGD